MLRQLMHWMLGFKSPSLHRMLFLPRRMLRKLMHRLLGFKSPSLHWMLRMPHRLRTQKT